MNPSKKDAENLSIFKHLVNGILILPNTLPKGGRVGECNAFLTLIGVFCSISLFFTSQAVFSQEGPQTSPPLLSGKFTPAPIFLPLENGSFEAFAKTAQGETVTSWQYYGGAKPQQLSDQSFHGAKAMRLDTGFVTQRVKIAPEHQGQPISVSLHAKGSGELPFWFLPVKQDGDKYVNTYADGWKGRSVSFPLADEYLPYTYTMERIPEGTEYVEVHFGSYSSIDALFDEISLYIGLAPQATAALQQQAALPEDIQLVDVAPSASIRTKPFGTLVRRMVDDNEGTGLTLERHPYVKTHTYEWILSEPVDLAKIRFTLPSTSFVLKGDTTGDGNYDTTLALEANYEKIGYWGRGDWPWYEKVIWPAIKVHAVKLVNFATPANNPIFTFQLLATETAAQGITTIKEKPATEAPELTPGKQLPLPPVLEQDRFLQGFHVEPWMFDMPGWLKQQPRPPLVEWQPFRKMVLEMRRMHCNLVWLFPPRTWVAVAGRQGGYPYDVMWPSQYFTWSHQEHLLREVTAALHGEGFTVFTQYRFPNWLEKTRPYDEPEPPVIDWYRRTFFTGSAVEMAGEGVDGVPVCLDEEYFGALRYPGQFFIFKDVDLTGDENALKKNLAHNHKVIANRAGFSKRWGGEQFPEKFEDSELYRKWVIYYYEQIASHFNETALAVKALNPKIVTVANIVNGEPFNDRYLYGWAYDIFGHQADIDYLGTDPYHTREDSNLGHYLPSKITKNLIASNKKRSTIVTLNFPWGQSKDKHPLTYVVHPPISTIGSVLGPLMHGAKAFAFWRYNFAFMEGYDRYVEQVFGMVDTFAAWGGKKATIPKKIAVLRSRASEDWWQLKIRHDKSAAKSDETLAFDNDKWLEEFLLTEGYPYELFYAEHPQDFQNLSEYELIILPFPYAISMEAYQLVEQAVQQSSKLLLFNKQGETDQMGNPYPRPLFAELIQGDQAVFISQDLREKGNFPNFRHEMKAMVEGLLGEKQLSVDANGSDVQIGWLEGKGKEIFVILTNWENKPSVVNLGIRFGATDRATGTNGKETLYQVTRRNLESVYEMQLNGTAVFSSTDLQNIKVKLSAGEAQILLISAVDASKK